MDWQNYISEQFHASVNNLLNAIEPLSPALEIASDLIVSALIQERRVFCAGQNNAQILANRFSTLLLNRYHQDRPSLPVFNLSADTMLLSAITLDHGIQESIAKPLRSLGQPNDLIVLFASDPPISGLLQTIQAAHDRDMSIILIGTSHHHECRSLLQSSDMDLYVHADHPAREMELLMFCIHSLCDLIEHKLFFGDDT